MTSYMESSFVLQNLRKPYQLFIILKSMLLQ